MTIAVNVPTHGGTCLDHVMCKLVGKAQYYAFNTDVTGHFPFLLSVYGSRAQLFRIISASKLRISFNLPIHTYPCNRENLGEASCTCEQPKQQQ